MLKETNFEECDKGMCNYVCVWDIRSQSATPKAHCPVPYYIFSFF